MDLSGVQDEFNSQKFKGEVCKNALVNNITFNSCTFTKCSFHETAFTDCSFHNCTFTKCELSLVKVKGCIFTDTRFEGSQLVGVNWTDSHWAKNQFLKPVDFIDCVINYSTFIELNLKKIQMVGCTARDVDFGDADLTQANCRGTDFSNSRFWHTNLTEADFTGALNYSIAVNSNTLKKTKFALPEAMSLLYGLDIILTESEL